MAILQADNLKTLPNVRHGFFTRDEKFDLEGRALLTCEQVHSSDCLTVTGMWDPSERPKADAMVTTARGFALGILTADCVPVLFADVHGNVIGAAHAGWRGALSGVLEKTLSAMEKLGAERHKIMAALGPCIWQDSYEVGPEFPAPFIAEDSLYEKYFRTSTRERHYLFDLPGYVVAQLQKLGVRDVAPSPADTFVDDIRFFSYRRDCLQGKRSTGRLISAIALQ